LLQYTFSLKERRPDSDMPTVYTFAVKDADSLIKWTQHISLAMYVCHASRLSFFLVF